MTRKRVPFVRYVRRCSVRAGDTATKFMACTAKHPEHRITCVRIEPCVAPTPHMGRVASRFWVNWHDVLTRRTASDVRLDELEQQPRSPLEDWLARRRFRVLGEKSKNRCWYCGLPALKMKRMTRDHQIPRAQGGTRAPENIVLACERCNSEKADMNVETYRGFLQNKKPSGVRVVFYGETLPRPIQVEPCSE